MNNCLHNSSFVVHGDLGDEPEPWAVLLEDAGAAAQRLANAYTTMTYVLCARCGDTVRMYKPESHASPGGG